MNDRKLTPDETALLAEAARRNIRVTRTGQAWNFLGPGVDISVSDLRSIRPYDLVAENPAAVRD